MWNMLKFIVYDLFLNHRILVLVILPRQYILNLYAILHIRIKQTRSTVSSERTKYRLDNKTIC